MKLYLHLLKKDLFQFRLFILLWVGVLAFEVLKVIYPGLHNGSEPLLISFALSSSTPKWILFGLITVLVIQAEKLVGDRAYWLTRPLPRKVLLWSKLAFVMLVLVVPLSFVTVLPVFLEGFSFREVLPLLVENILINLFWVFPVICIACWTPDLKGFAILAVVPSIMVLVGMILSEVISRGPLSTFIKSNSLSILASREIEGSSRVSGFAHIKSKEDPKAALEGEMKIANLPPGYWVFPTRVRSEMEYNRKISNFDSAQDTSYTYSGTQDDKFRWFQNLLPGTNLGEYSTQPEVKAVFLMLDDKVYHQCKSVGVHLKTVVDLILKKPAISGQMRPREGASLSNFGKRARVISWESRYEKNNQSHKAWIEEKNVKSLWMGYPRWQNPSRVGRYEPAKEVFYLLYHQRLKQVWIPYLSTKRPEFYRSNCEIVEAELDFYENSGMDETWISEAKLVQIELEEEAQCQKEFYAENFVLSR
jgi:hypothetical protein